MKEEVSPLSQVGMNRQAVRTVNRQVYDAHCLVCRIKCAQVVEKPPEELIRNIFHVKHTLKQPTWQVRKSVSRHERNFEEMKKIIFALLAVL